MKCRDGHACPAHVLADGDAKVPCGLLQAGKLHELTRLACEECSAPDATPRVLARGILALLRQLEDAERRAEGHEELTRAAQAVADAHERTEKSWTSITALEKLLQEQAEDRAGRCFGSSLEAPVVAGHVACTRCCATFPAPEGAPTAPIPFHPPERSR
jgi:hypothetical protein